MNLFIDTNVLLAFFQYSSDDLEELRKLIGLLGRGRVTLFVPDQVMDEYRRNREGQIASAIKVLREQRLNVQYPTLCREYPEYDALRRLQREYQEQHETLLKKVLEDTEKQELKADIVIAELFSAGHRVSVDAEIIEKARQRHALGNPPGKGGSLGDAVNWEALLAAVPEFDDLCFVSDDGDFASPLQRERLDGFLSEEWSRRKTSTLHFYRRLSSFFGAHFPTIKLADELDKDLLIAELAASGSFATTHTIVAKLRKFTALSAVQRNEIVSAILGNNQVFWILGDDDVNRFTHWVIDGSEDKIDAERLTELKSLLLEAEAKLETVDVEELPF